MDLLLLLTPVREGRRSNERRYQAKQRLLFRSIRAGAEKIAHGNEGDRGAGRPIRLVYDDRHAICRVPAEEPGIAIGASIKLSTLIHVKLVLP